MVFPVIMYGCESCTIKKAEHQRVDAFELWCWRRLFRVPWTARRSNQSILKEINLEYSLEGLMLKLKLQYFGHLMRRASSLKRPRCWERLRIRDKGATNDEMVGWHHQHNGHEFEQTPGDSEGRGSLVCCSLWGCRVRHNLVTGQQREFKKFDSDSSGILIIASVQEQILGTPYLPFDIIFSLTIFKEKNY